MDKTTENHEWEALISDERFVIIVTNLAEAEPGTGGTYVRNSGQSITFHMLLYPIYVRGQIRICSSTGNHSHPTILLRHLSGKP